MRWLIPRLDRCHADHPDVEVSVTTVSTEFEQLRGGVDVAIRRGVARADAWPQHLVVPVLNDVDTLIMSPVLFARRPILSPADIEGHMLLASQTRAGDWDDWLEEAGLGIGIGPLPMLEIDLASGRLMAPSPHLRVARTGYVAIVPRQAVAQQLLADFVDWLVGEAHAPGQPNPAET